LDCLRELNGPSLTALTLDAVFARTVDMTRAADRTLVADLIVKALDTELVSSDDLHAAALRLMSTLEELSLDLPKVPEHAAHILAKLFGEDPLGFASIVSGDASSAAVQKRVFTASLRTLIDSGALNDARAIWRHSASTLIGSDAEQRTFLKQNSLGSLDDRFDNSSLTEAWRSSDATSLSAALKGLPSEHIQPAARVLCVLAAEDNTLSRLGELRSIASPLPAQLRVLFGAHEAWHSRSEKKGELQQILEALYSTKVVGRKSIEKWLEDSSDTVPHKGEALFDVSPWWSRKMQEEKDALKAAKAQQNAQ